MKGSAQVKALNYISRSRVSLTLPYLLREPSDGTTSVRGFSRFWDTIND